jgi:cobalt-zinc-cadmium efflux system outer membrane protein
MVRRALTAGVAIAIMTSAAAGRADGSSCTKVTRATVVPCAEAASLTVRRQRLAVDVAAARRTAVSPLLPSNPAVTLTGARRMQDGGSARATNWSATLSQELEIAGQRGIRRDAAAHQVSAEQHRTLATERDVAAAALVAYFDALAAAEVVRLATRLEATGKAMAVVTRARADSGAASPLEADVAESTALALTRARLAADRDADAARVAMTTLLGRDPAAALVDVDGALVPLAGADAIGAAARVPEQPEIKALEEERRAFEARADALRRERIPNPTLQVFVQNDGFDERVYGGGVSVPVPLPYPFGRTNKGEIAEAEAQSARSATDAEAERREVRRRLALAARTFESRRVEVAAFTPERIARAERTLADIATEIGAGRLAVRDAILGQQALIDLLRGNIEARRALCIASVELARAAGVPIERGGR